MSGVPATTAPGCGSTPAEASDRAGGSAGNKGYEAAEAALLAADAVAHLDGGDAAD